MAITPLSPGRKWSNDPSFMLLISPRIFISYHRDCKVDIISGHNILSLSCAVKFMLSQRSPCELSMNYGNMIISDGYFRFAGAVLKVSLYQYIDTVIIKFLLTCILSLMALSNNVASACNESLSTGVSKSVCAKSSVSVSSCVSSMLPMAIWSTIPVLSSTSILQIYCKSSSDVIEWEFETIKLSYCCLSAKKPNSAWWSIRSTL